MNVKLFRSFDELPPRYLRLFNEVGRTNFYLSLQWFQNIAATVRDPGDDLRIYGVDDGDGIDEAKAILVMRRRLDIDGRKGLNALAGYSNFYSMIFAPVMRRDESQATSILRAWTKSLIAERPAWDVIHISALEHDSPFLEPMIEALRQVGFLVSQRPEFVNWYLPVAGMSFERYFELLPGQLRTQITTKTRRITRKNSIRFESFTGTDGLEKALAAYQQVYSHSWKEPEPYPDFIPGLIQASAEAGALRMSVLYVDDTPAASQIWLVSDSKATIYKLAYDESFKKQSVGSILTAHIMQELMARDELIEVDFGHGDDPYKKDWLNCRRERQQIEAYNLRTARGLLSGIILTGGRAVKSRVKRLSGMSLKAPTADSGG